MLPAPVKRPHFSLRYLEEERLFHPLAEHAFGQMSQDTWGLTLDEAIARAGAYVDRDRNYEQVGQVSQRVIEDAREVVAVIADASQKMESLREALANLRDLRDETARLRQQLVRRTVLNNKRGGKAGHKDDLVAKRAILLVMRAEDRDAANSLHQMLMEALLEELANSPVAALNEILQGQLEVLRQVQWHESGHFSDELRNRVASAVQVIEATLTLADRPSDQVPERLADRQRSSDLIESFPRPDLIESFPRAEVRFERMFNDAFNRNSSEKENLLIIPDLNSRGRIQNLIKDLLGDGPKPDMDCKY
ncbi:MAG: hypothetical protein EA369_09095 [Bradymonadales bacterium]|nr:MAG: hypothetical protein EA369_09095 [Bradymonadales bacterium]